MSIWADTVMEMLLDDCEMTEDDALDLYRALSVRYGWTGADGTEVQAW